MTQIHISDLRPNDYVWFPTTWPSPVVYHDRGDRDDRELTHEDRTALMAGWNFTRCGILVAEPIWEPGWSEQNNRFAAGPSRGHDLPLRLLNPAFSRPCRRCFITESA